MVTRLLRGLCKVAARILFHDAQNLAFEGNHHCVVYWDRAQNEVACSFVVFAVN